MLKDTVQRLKVKQVREVSESQIVKRCVSEEKDFELYVVCGEEGVQVSEDRGDMVSRTGACKQMGRGVLDILMFTEDFGW